MKYYRLPVTGIDAQIQHLQDELDTLLGERLIIPDDQFQIFGRVHKAPIKQGYRPEAYVSGGNYHPVLLDDRYAFQCFFGTGDKYTVDGAYNVRPIHIVFFVDLSKIYLYTTGNVYNTALGDVRADEEIRETVQSILGQNLYGFTLESIETTVQAAMQGYVVGRFTANQTQVQSTYGLKEADMHPNHIFRINGTIRYPKPQLQS